MDKRQHPEKAHQRHTPDPQPQPPTSRPPAANGGRRRWRRRHRITSSKLQLVKVLLLITLCSSLVPAGMTKRARSKPYGKHFVIHVPMKIRTHHHMHTVFTHLQGQVGKGSGGAAGGSESGKASKQTIYKIMGYSTHHTTAGVGGGGGGVGVGGAGAGGRGFGHGGGHGHGFAHTYRQGHRGGGGYGEINYDDYTNTNCDDSLAHGDMIFNHYSRQDEEYPDVEELIEDERERDEWE